MPNLQALVSNGSQQRLTTSFPGVTWPAQASMLTGKLPSEHGVIANGFYWRDENEIEIPEMDKLPNMPTVDEYIKHQIDLVKNPSRPSRTNQVDLGLGPRRPWSCIWGVFQYLMAYCNIG